MTENLAFLPVSLRTLTNIAIGPPEKGTVDFAALHSLLHAIINYLGIHDLSASIAADPNLSSQNTGAVVTGFFPSQTQLLKTTYSTTTKPKDNMFLLGKEAVEKPLVTYQVVEDSSKSVKKEKGKNGTVPAKDENGNTKQKDKDKNGTVPEKDENGKAAGLQPVNKQNPPKSENKLSKKEKAHDEENQNKVETEKGQAVDDKNGLKGKGEVQASAPEASELTVPLLGVNTKSGSKKSSKSTTAVGEQKKKSQQKEVALKGASSDADALKDLLAASSTSNIKEDPAVYIHAKLSNLEQSVQNLHKMPSLVEFMGKPMGADDLYRFLDMEEKADSQSKRTHKLTEAVAQLYELLQRLKADNAMLMERNTELKEMMGDMKNELGNVKTQMTTYSEKLDELPDDLSDLASWGQLEDYLIHANPLRQKEEEDASDRMGLKTKPARDGPSRRSLTGGDEKPDLAKIGDDKEARKRKTQEMEAAGPGTSGKRGAKNAGEKVDRSGRKDQVDEENDMRNAGRRAPTEDEKDLKSGRSRHQDDDRDIKSAKSGIAYDDRDPRSAKSGIAYDDRDPRSAKSGIAYDDRDSRPAKKGTADDDDRDSKSGKKGTVEDDRDLRSGKKRIADDDRDSRPAKKGTADDDDKDSRSGKRGIADDDRDSRSGKRGIADDDRDSRSGKKGTAEDARDLKSTKRGVPEDEKDMKAGKRGLQEDGRDVRSDKKRLPEEEGKSSKKWNNDADRDNTSEKSKAKRLYDNDDKKSSSEDEKSTSLRISTDEEPDLKVNRSTGFRKKQNLRSDLGSSSDTEDYSRPTSGSHRSGPSEPLANKLVDISSTVELCKNLDEKFHQLEKQLIAKVAAREPEKKPEAKEVSAAIDSMELNRRFTEFQEELGKTLKDKGGDWKKAIKDLEKVLFRELWNLENKVKVTHTGMKKLMRAKDDDIPIQSTFSDGGTEQIDGESRTDNQPSGRANSTTFVKASALSRDMKDSKERLQELETQFNLLYSNVTELRNRQPSILPTGQDGELSSRLQIILTSLRTELDAVASKAQTLVDDNTSRQHYVEELEKLIQELDANKADKEFIANEVEMKADKKFLETKVSRALFEKTMDELNKMIEELINNLSGHDEEWRTVMQELGTEMAEKLNRDQFTHLKENLEKQLKVMSNKVNHMNSSMRDLDDEAAGLRRKLAVRFNCISCDKPIMVVPQPPVPSIPYTAGMPYSRTNKPYITYEIEQYRQQSHSPCTGKAQMNFDRAMIDRAERDRMMLERKFQVAGALPRPPKQNTSTPNTVKELVDIYGSRRACGGSHTITYPNKKGVKIVNQSYHEELVRSQSTLTESRVNQTNNRCGPYQKSLIMGADGHLYRGNTKQNTVPLPQIECAPPLTSDPVSLTGPGTFLTSISYADENPSQIEPLPPIKPAPTIGGAGSSSGSSTDKSSTLSGFRSTYDFST